MSLWLACALVGFACATIAGVVGLMLGTSIGQRAAVEYFCLRDEVASPHLATTIRLVRLSAIDHGRWRRATIEDALDPILQPTMPAAEVLDEPGLGFDRTRPPWA